MLSEPLLGVVVLCLSCLACLVGIKLTWTSVAILNVTCCVRLELDHEPASFPENLLVEDLLLLRYEHTTATTSTLYQCSVPGYEHTGTVSQISFALFGSLSLHGKCTTTVIFSPLEICVFTICSGCVLLSQLLLHTCYSKSGTK